MADFYEDFTCERWGGKPGVTFRSGYYRERLTTDPNDEGKVIPVAEDPVYQALLQDAPQEPSAPPAPPEA